MVWLLSTLGISAIFVGLAAHNLADYRPVSNDEVELIAVAYKLATRGVLGSDMYVGFFGGDQHHFETLPLQHVLDAAAFRVLGAGILQARLVSLLAGVSIVWTVGWLAYRWYGPGAAVLCELLLVAWPSNLTAASGGLPLLGVARTARYDVLAVAAVWLAILLLDVTPRRPGPRRALATGVCCGLAALSQFFGSFVLPLVPAIWLRSRSRALTLLVVWLAGLALVVGPYVVLVARYPADLAGQLGVFGGRGDFLRPGFYVDNVLSEWTRYAHLAPASSFSTWLLCVGLAPAVLGLAWRGCPGDRLLLASLATFAAALALLDQTKAPLYSVLLLPSICLVLAAGASAFLGWARRRGRAIWPGLAAGVVALGTLGVGLDGLAAYQLDWDEATRVTPYLAFGQQLQAAIPAGSVVLGPERWWWALHEHRYVSLRSLWFQWSAAAAAAREPPRFVDWVKHAQADSVIVNINVRADVHAFPDALQAQFWDFIERCTTRVADLDDPTYFETEVYAVLRPPPGGCG